MFVFNGEGVGWGDTRCCGKDECFLFIEVHPQRPPEFFESLEEPGEVFVGEANGRIVHDGGRVGLASLAVVMCVARPESCCRAESLFVVDFGGKGFQDQTGEEGAEGAALGEAFCLH